MRWSNSKEIRINMMTKNLFPEPTFVPKVIDKSILKSGIEFPCVLIDAHTVTHKHPLFIEIKEKNNQVIIDPVTHFVQFEESRIKPSFKKLPYSSVNDVQKLYSDPTYRLESFIKPTVDFQIDNESSLIISPYLCSDDINGIAFSTNLTMLGEAITNLQSRKETRPLFAPICIGSHILADNKMVNFVVDSYKDKSIYDHISGYFILVNDLDDRLASEDILMGLAHLTYQLSREKKVIVNRLGGFGEILNIIGSHAFVSSPAAGETFSMKQLQTKSQDIRGRDHKLWIYIPELFDYVNEVELSPEHINYQCNCPACTNSLGLDTKVSQRKVHFLYKRMDSVNSLKGKSREDRIKEMTGKLEHGISLAQRYVAKGSDLKITHMVRWKRVLEASSTWNYEEDDKELSQLLEALG